MESVDRAGRRGENDRVLWKEGDVVARIRPVLVLVLGLLLGLVVSACKEKTPIEDRMMAFFAQATDVLKANAADPDKCAAEITKLAQANEALLNELRAVGRNEQVDGKEVKIPEAAQDKLQKAVADLMQAAMNEKLMASPKVQEALKALFQ